MCTKAVIIGKQLQVVSNNVVGNAHLLLGKEENNYQVSSLARVPSSVECNGKWPSEVPSFL